MNRFGLVARSAAVAAIGVASLGSVALAQDTVTQEITQGAFTASVADATLSSVAYSNTAVTSNGVLTLTAEDSRGVGTGWTVTISSTDFIYGGTSPLGEDIPVAGFQTTGFGAVSVVAGQDTLLPTAGTGGSFASAVTVLEAASGAGSGIYTLPINASLDIPAQSQAGTYVADLTVTIVDGNQP